MIHLNTRHEVSVGLFAISFPPTVLELLLVNPWSSLLSLICPSIRFYLATDSNCAQLIRNELSGISTTRTSIFFRVQRRYIPHAKDLDTGFQQEWCP